MSEDGRRRGLGWLGLLVLGVLHLAPLSLQPWARTLDRNPDTRELLWRLAWGARALVSDPAGLMDANTFYPDEGTYATMDYLVGVSVLAIPFQALSDDPLLVYNLTSFVCLALCAAGAVLLARELLGPSPAAWVAGALLAFNPILLKRLGQLNILAIHWLPFALLALHRLRLAPGWRHALLFAAAAFAAIVSGGYQAVFLAGTAGWALVVLASDPAEGRWRSLAWAAGALVLAGVLFAPVATPYVSGATGGGRVRSFGDVMRASPRPLALLYLDSSVHEQVREGLGVSEHFGPALGAQIFPGVVVVGLALVGGIALARSRVPGRRRLLVLYGTLAVAGSVLSLGSHLPGYRVLFDTLPPLRMVRAPSRFSLPGLLGLAVLAAAGVDRLRTLAAGRVPRLVPLLVPLACALHLAETWAPRGEQGYRFHPAPPVYEWLAEQPGDFGVAELPSTLDLNPFYLVYSTYHWKGLVNGYQGSFMSALHDELLFRTLPAFPSAASVDRLREILGLRYLVLHHDPEPDRFRRSGHWHDRERLRRAIEDPPEGTRVAWRDEHAVVLELVTPAGGDVGLVHERLGGGSRLRDHAIMLTVAEDGPPGAAAAGGREAVVSLNRRELARLPVGPEPRTHRVEIPAGAVAPGVNSIRVRSGYAPRPRLPERWLAELTLGDSGTALPMLVEARSSGPRTGDRVSIEVNQDRLVSAGRGYSLVVIDPARAEILDVTRFDTEGGPGPSRELAGYVAGLPAGTVVVLAARGRPWRHLTEEGVGALRRLGSAADPRSERPESHVLLGVVGAAPGTVPEARSASEASALAHGRPRYVPRLRLLDLALDPPGA